MLDLEQQVDLILDDLLHGRKTVEGLIAQKSLYEGKNTMLTNVISEGTESGAIGEALACLYMGICIVLHIVEKVLDAQGYQWPVEGDDGTPNQEAEEA